MLFCSLTMIALDLRLVADRLVPADAYLVDFMF